MSDVTFQTHPATPGKPCPGNGTCCNRPEFDRAMSPCDLASQLMARVRELEKRLSAEHAAIASKIGDIIRRIGPARTPESIRQDLEDLFNQYHFWARAKP